MAARIRRGREQLGWVPELGCKAALDVAHETLRGLRDEFELALKQRRRRNLIIAGAAAAVILGGLAIFLIVFYANRRKARDVIDIRRIALGRGQSASNCIERVDEVVYGSLAALVVEPTRAEPDAHTAIE